MSFWILLFFGLDGWILYKLFGWFGLLFLHDDSNDFDDDAGCGFHNNLDDPYGGMFHDDFTDGCGRHHFDDFTGMHDDFDGFL